MHSEPDLLSGWGGRRGEVASRPAAAAVAVWLLPALVFGLFAANVALHFPGVMNNDSIGQYSHAITGGCQSP